MSENSYSKRVFGQIVEKVSSINGVCQRKPCTTGYGTVRKPTGTIGDMRRRSLKPQIERFPLCKNDTPQIERYPSVRTICLGGEGQKVYITTKVCCFT